MEGAEGGKAVSKQDSFLDYCPSCKRKHVVAQRPCPTCHSYETPQPVSDAVANACHANYQCDGCRAYEDHRR